MKTKWTLLLLLLMPPLVRGQQDSEIIKKQFTLPAPNTTMLLNICNVFGNIDVEAHKENTILLEVEKLIEGRNEADVKLGMEELTIGVEQEKNLIRVSAKTPNTTYRHRDDKYSCGWAYHGEEDRDYWYRLNYKVKVPEGISIKVSTVNKGDISIKGVKGEVHANNVNGNIHLKDIRGNTKAHTVNGGIGANYIALPPKMATFDTVNGDIEITTPSGSNAVYTFDTRWGEVFSEFEFDKKLVPKMIATKGKHGGTKYKVHHANSYQVGSGGPNFQFKTLNGNISVKKSK